MSLLGFLTGVGSLFSGGGGSKTKESKNENTTLNQASLSTGTQKQQQNLSTTSVQDTTARSNVNSTQSSSVNTSGKENTSFNQSSTGTTTASSVGTDTRVQSGQEQSRQQQSTTLYSSDILASLDSLLKSTFAAGGAEMATDALQGRLMQIEQQAVAPQFDVNNFVSGIASAAGAEIQNDLDSKINTMLSATGSSESGNSMAALLGNKLRNDAAASMAGVVSQATAQGEAIRQAQQGQITEEISGLTGQLSGQIAQLLQVAQGATQQTTGVGSVLTSQQQSGQTTNNQQQTTRENTSGSQNTTTQQQQTGVVKQNESSTTSQHQTGKENQNSTTQIDEKQGTLNTGVQTTNTNTSSKTGGGVTDLLTNLFTNLNKSQLAA